MYSNQYMKHDKISDFFIRKIIWSRIYMCKDILWHILVWEKDFNLKKKLWPVTLSKSEPWFNSKQTLIFHFRMYKFSLFLLFKTFIRKMKGYHHILSFEPPYLSFNKDRLWSFNRSYHLTNHLFLIANIYPLPQPNSV